MVFLDENQDKKKPRFGRHGLDFKRFNIFCGKLNKHQHKVAACWFGCYVINNRFVTIFW
jgi:hypothetical protein